MLPPLLAWTPTIGPAGPWTHPYRLRTRAAAFRIHLSVPVGLAHNATVPAGDIVSSQRTVGRGRQVEALKARVAPWA